MSPTRRSKVCTLWSIPPTGAGASSGLSPCQLIGARGGDACLEPPAVRVALQDQMSEQQGQYVPLMDYIKTTHNGVYWRAAPFNSLIWTSLVKIGIQGPAKLAELEAVISPWPTVGSIRACLWTLGPLPVVPPMVAAAITYPKLLSLANITRESLASQTLKM